MSNLATYLLDTSFDVHKGTHHMGLVRFRHVNVYRRTRSGPKCGHGERALPFRQQPPATTPLLRIKASHSDCPPQLDNTAEWDVGLYAG